MPTPGPESAQASLTGSLVALDLTVNNHPGVMSHVCGLFARRAFNLEAIVVAPAGDATVSRMWLLVKDDEKLEQMVRQVGKLHDVLQVRAGRADRDCSALLHACLATLEAKVTA